MFEVLTMMAMKIAVFWDVVSYSVKDAYPRSSGYKYPFTLISSLPLTEPFSHPYYSKKERHQALLLRRLFYYFKPSQFSKFDLTLFK